MYSIEKHGEISPQIAPRKDGIMRRNGGFIGRDEGLMGRDGGNDGEGGDKLCNRLKT